MMIVTHSNNDRLQKSRDKETNGFVRGLFCKSVVVLSVYGSCRCKGF